MKPTMPMNAFPQGGPPGSPSGGGFGPPGGGPPGGGGFGPPGQTPPPSYGGPPPAPKKSKTGLYIGGGCGCLLLLGCLVAGGVYGVVSSLGPGDEVQSQEIAIGQPFTLNYTQDGSQKYEAWLEVDVSYSAGYSLTGPILLGENGAAFGQYTLEESGNGSPIRERNSSMRMNFSQTNINGSGSASGTLSLFPIPARASGGTVSLSGTIVGTPGTSGTVRLFVAERD